MIISDDVSWCQDVMVGQQLDKEKREVLEKIKQKKEAHPSGKLSVDKRGHQLHCKRDVGRV